MFGYVRPYKPDLLVKEYNTYKSVYCGLCKSLGENFSFSSRFFLNYDATFLSILEMSIKKNNMKFKKHHCKANPIKQCSFCECDDNNIYSFSGAVSIIMTYYKIKDNILDSNFFKKSLSYLAISIIFRGYKKAKYIYPQVEKIVSDFYKEQIEVENDPSSGIDISAMPTANVLSKIFTMIASNKDEERILSSIGFFIGRWIYLIDAADDIDKDIKNKNFNPFVNELIKSKGIQRNEVNKYCNDVLNQTISQIILSFNLLNLSDFNGILNNIIFKGMPMMQKQILFKNKK